MTRSFSSRGVPGIATRALTGNDSGGSGSLKHRGSISIRVSRKTRVGKLKTHWLISQIKPTRSPSFSPNPMIPPLQTLIPAERTASIVSSRSSNFRVVMTCQGSV